MLEYWVWLANLPQFGPITQNELLKRYKEPEAIYELSPEEIAATVHLNKKQRASLEVNHSLEPAKRILDKCETLGIQILTMQHTAYPEKAKQKDAPILLYCKGNLPDSEQTVGIVGARRCDRSAREYAIEIAKECTAQGKAIISGMALGVDAYAHTACLKNNGFTIAFLGNGLDICYPKAHTQLMEMIAQKGSLLSEYPPGIPPKSYHFPYRNRLIAAWSDELYCIGAGKNSGALITAQYASAYGRACVFRE